MTHFCHVNCEQFMTAFYKFKNTETNTERKLYDNCWSTIIRHPIAFVFALSGNGS